MSKKKSSPPKELSEAGAADVAYIIQYTTDLSQFSLTMESSKIPFTGTKEILNAMQTFIDDCVSEEKDFFDDLELPTGVGGGFH